MIGLGKLGLPCLLAMEKHGNHQIFGYDISEKVVSQIRTKSVDYWEKGVNEYLKDSNLVVEKEIVDLVEKCEIIFIAVQTPHETAFEGRTPTPKSRKNFDYFHLRSVATSLKESFKSSKNNPLIVIISTVLPGTMRTEILPILNSTNKNLRFAYNPYFIAMGTTIEDFLNPEFILLGSDSSETTQTLINFYSFIETRCVPMQIESAELTKVAYNTFIGFKIIFANALAEITNQLGGNVDEVTTALASANYRIMSPTYFHAGMGDGGGCHPRDQIAMSWLARKLDLSFDIFEAIALARDNQTKNQSKYLIRISKKYKLPICLLGVSYKPNSPLDIGSPARLLQYYLEKQRVKIRIFDPWIYPENDLPEKPHIFFISSRHDEFKHLTLPLNSILVDPWNFNKTSNVHKIVFGREINSDFV